MGKGDGDTLPFHRLFFFCIHQFIIYISLELQTSFILFTRPLYGTDIGRSPPARQAGTAYKLRK